MNAIESMIAKLCPGGVPLHRLDNVFNVRGGYTPSKSDASAWSGGTVPWFRMEDIRKNGRVLDSAIQCVNSAAVKGGRLFPANSFLVATTATIGEHALVTVPHLSNQRFTSLSLKPDFVDKYDTRYLFHYLYVLSDWCKKNTTTSSFAAVDMTGFRKFSIPEPPLEVQHEIARILDKFPALEAELKAELKARRRQFEGYRNLLIDEASDSASSVKLSEVLQYEQPTKYLVSSTDYSDVHPTPVLTAGKTFVLGHTDETSGIYPASTDNPVIIFDDFTTAFHWVDFPFKAKSSAMKMLKPRREVSADFRYVYYAMSCVNFQPSQHTRHWISQYSEFEIPLPDMEVQLEIVRALDALSALVEDASSGLPAEISFRRKQYEYYREQLLTFKELKS